ncbi:MAG: helix-turn-helix domain-containing protein [Anaerolineales bacterium]|nr:helix-turn-helix domain-containing protein [Anaerolineales bacterium]
MAQIDEMRLVTRVARMYYEWDMKQSAIARQLGLSQPTVSRLLQQAKDEGIIRISVSVPQGLYTELEEQLVKKYRLRDAIVVDCSGEGDERFIERQIGAAAAYYLSRHCAPMKWLDLFLECNVAGIGGCDAPGPTKGMCASCRFWAGWLALRGRRMRAA